MGEARLGWVREADIGEKFVAGLRAGKLAIN